MNFFGRAIDSATFLRYVEDRLSARGLSGPEQTRSPLQSGVAPRVDPLSFNLHALSEHADTTRGLPIETHRGGVIGTSVVRAKKLFRAAGQTFINEAFGRQIVFNGHVRDSYAQLSAELLRMRERIAELEAQLQAATSSLHLPATKTTSETSAKAAPTSTDAPSVSTASRSAQTPKTTKRRSTKR